VPGRFPQFRRHGRPGAEHVVLYACASTTDDPTIAVDTTTPAPIAIGGNQQTAMVRHLDTKEHGMFTLIAVVFGGLVLAAAIALHDLQLRLEHWDYERHAED
jgi:hypothetical protein